jgi:hypothetical protein
MGFTQARLHHYFQGQVSWGLCQELAWGSPAGEMSILVAALLFINYR